jgi:alpha-galactosidase
MVSTGLAKAGYKYVNMDDCWAGTRDAQGNIHPDATAFPNGVKPLADYAHEKGLLFGLYSDAGTKTCAGRPGSLHYETNDANMYASWGVDYLKYDNCNTDGSKPETRYPVMRDALNKTGRHIFYSMCEWGQDNPATWAPTVGNSWRTTGDIGDTWASMTNLIGLNDAWARYAAPGGWNDPDMLEVGNGGLTLNEQRAHFSLWCLTKAPLLIGCDITKMSNDTFEILTAPEVIAVNQDRLGVQGKRVVSGTHEVWAGTIESGWAVILFNRDTTTAEITAHWSDIGIPQGTEVTVRDLWARKDLGKFSNSFAAQVPNHGVVFVSMAK